MQLTKMELARIESQFYFEPEKYIKENGLVTDKEKAIELLCKTNKAWAVLDESLKMDPEVIMYYQPSGYSIIWFTDLESHNNLGCRKYCEEGFSNVFFGYLIAGKDGDAFTPEIEFPENFDFELYCKIQYEFQLGNTIHREIDMGLKRVELGYGITYIYPLYNKPRYFPKDYYGDNHLGSQYAYTENHFYDRSYLKDIVPRLMEESKKGKEKTIGVHPSTRNDLAWYFKRVEE